MPAGQDNGRGAHGRGGGRDQEADRAGSDDEDDVAGIDPGTGQRRDRHRHRLGQGRDLIGEAAGHAMQEMDWHGREGGKGAVDAPAG